jgi:hypothetical protein
MPPHVSTADDRSAAFNEAIAAVANDATTKDEDEGGVISSWERALKYLPEVEHACQWVNAYSEDGYTGNLGVTYPVIYVWRRICIFK